MMDDDLDLGGPDVGAGNTYRDPRMYDNFDIIRLFISHLSALCRPTRAASCVLLSAHDQYMLIGACNPMVCPIPVFRALLKNEVVSHFRMDASAAKVRVAAPCPCRPRPPALHLVRLSPHMYTWHPSCSRGGTLSFPRQHHHSTLSRPIQPRHTLLEALAEWTSGLTPSPQPRRHYVTALLPLHTLGDPLCHVPPPVHLIPPPPQHACVRGAQALDEGAEDAQAFLDDAGQSVLFASFDPRVQVRANLLHCLASTHCPMWPTSAAVCAATLCMPSVPLSLAVLVALRPPSLSHTHNHTHLSSLSLAHSP